MVEEPSLMAWMMPSFNALRLAGRLRPTVSTASCCATSSSAVVAEAAFPMAFIYVLCRIVIFYNELDGSQWRPSSRPPSRDPEPLAHTIPKDEVWRVHST